MSSLRPRFRHRRCVLLLFAVVSFGAADNAYAQAREPTPSTADAPGLEFGIIPLLGGSSDLGVGGGALASLTSFAPGYEPYRVRAEAGAVATFKRAADAGWQAPYQDVYLALTLPDLIPHRLRLEVRPSYTRESTQAYYGIGNASHAPTHGPEGQSGSDYFQYGRMHPSLQLRILLTLGGAFFLQLGAALTYNQLDVHPDSQLDRDRHSSDVHIEQFFGPLRAHFVDEFEQTLIYDTRDDETSPTRGMYHQLRLRLHPGGSGALPYRYGQFNATARGYVSVRPWLTLAARVVGDLQFGDVPFYELPRYDDTFALGGVSGVRGVPGQRYYGKRKLFGNLEARMRVATFDAFELPCSLAAVVFVDAGRLWSDWTPDPVLDGRGLGLKYGLGAGLRLQQGRAFVVRADAALSPDARPIGVYVTAGQIF